MMMLLLTELDQPFLLFFLLRLSAFSDLQWALEIAVDSEAGSTIFLLLFKAIHIQSSK